MLCLLILASAVLPAVMGVCCYPDKYTATVYITGDPLPRKTTVDFKRDRYVNRIIGHAVLEYFLHDQASEKGYFMFKDGSCQVRDEAKSFSQCLGSFKTSFGVSTLAGGSHVETFGYTGIDGTSLFDVVTKKGCVPVFTVIHYDGTHRAEINTDVSLTIDESEINPDLSNCKPAETAG